MAKRISVKEASKQLDINQETLRRGLRQKELPIGWAVKNDTEYSYYIYQEMIDRCLHGNITESSLDLLDQLIDYLYELKKELAVKKDLEG